eukprot:283841-Chlamydomonas_euryale.AAC.1
MHACMTACMQACWKRFLAKSPDRVALGADAQLFGVAPPPKTEPVQAPVHHQGVLHSHGGGRVGFACAGRYTYVGMARSVHL